MKDPKDKKTLPLIPEPKKRGRPPTGVAMTSTERKALQRARDRVVFDADFLNVSTGDFSAVTTGGLVEHLAAAVGGKYHHAAKLIAAELVKRAK